jgi:DNA-binding PadR family transcriptional regulator
MDENIIDFIKSNEKYMEIFKDEKTLDTIKAIKEMFLEKFLERGDIRLLILDAISEKPKHGYQIITSISKKFENFYRPSSGAIYPTLQSLDEEGLVKLEIKGSKKVYSITNKGEKFLKQNRKRMDDLTTGFREVYLLRDQKYVEKFQEISSLWPQIAFLLFYKSREAMKNGDPQFDKKLQATEKVLKQTLEDLNEVWKTP